MSGSGAVVTGVRARAYRVPTDAPEADGTLAWADTSVVVVAVHAGGVVGTGWTYAHQACAGLIETVLASAVRGKDVLDVPAAWQAMQETIRNLGRPGLVSCAMSAVEIALRDAAARCLGVPLCRLLGRAHDGVAVYGSGGFTTYHDDGLRTQLRRWIDEQQLPAVKIKIGESWGTEQERDLGRADFARQVVGDRVDLYVDSNGAYSVGQAVRGGQLLDDLGVRWFEEPVSSDDLVGLRRVRDGSAADVAAGEYGYDLPYFGAMLDAEAVDCLQLDVTRCGEMGEWLRALGVVPRPRAHRTEAVRRNPGSAGRRGPPGPLRAGHGMTLKEADADPFRVA